jgi:lipopolysaccharide/colanic/teichoic acid biosynthesis glycosyltransferase
MAVVPTVGGHRSAVLHRMLALADVVGSATAALVASVVCGLSAADGAVLALVCMISLPVLAFACGLYVAHDLRSWATGVPEVKRVLFAIFVLSWVVYASAVAIGIATPGRLAFVASVVAFPLTVACRAAARAIAHRADHLHERVVIVGSGVVAATLVQKLRSHRELGLVPVGIIEDEAHGDVQGLPHLGMLAELSDILERESIDRVIIAFTRASHVQLLDVIRACRDNRLPVHVVPRLFEFLDGTRALDHIGGLPILSLGVPRLSDVACRAKHGFDVLVSGAGLLVLSPLLVMIAIAIRLESPAPVLFRQPRGGRGDSVFTLLKFRSMYAGSDGRKDDLRAQNNVRDGVMFKVHRDPRVTRVGRGPAPLLLGRASAAVKRPARRHEPRRPAPAGPRGGGPAGGDVARPPARSASRADGPVAGLRALGHPVPGHGSLRYQYVVGWSLARDLEILLATAPAVLSGRGAY